MGHLSGQSSPKKEIGKRTWTIDEDQRLAQVIEVHGPGKWKSIVAKSGLKRCAKNCRLRWVNYLRPNLKKGKISVDEEDLIIRLHKLLGNRWSLITGRLPGRTDNEVKNYWNCHLKKRFTQQKVVLQKEFVHAPPPPQTGSLMVKMQKEGEADISKRGDEDEDGGEDPKAGEEEEEEDNNGGVCDYCRLDDEDWSETSPEGWSETSPVDQ